MGEIAAYLNAGNDPVEREKLMMEVKRYNLLGGYP